MINPNIKLGIIGLGYVGLPLSIAFSKVRKVIAYDINALRIEQLKNNLDVLGELPKETLLSCKDIIYTNHPDELAGCNFFIITVPTPVKNDNRPDFGPLISASKIVAKYLKPDDVVIYESTVYPGATEEICVPILETHSNLKYINSLNNAENGFYCGYSPERVNPGDKNRSVTDIIKITSGSTKEIALIIDNLYKEIIKAGTHMAPSIKVAEAAKVIENIQRDVNIALINEVSIILTALNIETEATLRAAETKWNFVSYRPGMVGGHCIGIDPYYFKYKAQSIGIYPEIISAVRRLNDGMPTYVANQFVKALIKKKIDVSISNVLILGLTFKENCPDLRNSKIFNLVDELHKYGCNIDIYDPIAPKNNGLDSTKATFITNLIKSSYDGIIFAVKHKELVEMTPEKLHSLGKFNHVFYDLKNVYESKHSDIRL